MTSCFLILVSEHSAETNLNFLRCNPNSCSKRASYLSIFYTKKKNYNKQFDKQSAIFDELITLGKSIIFSLEHKQQNTHNYEIVILSKVPLSISFDSEISLKNDISSST